MLAEATGLHGAGCVATPLRTRGWKLQAEEDAPASGSTRATPSSSSTDPWTPAVSASLTSPPKRRRLKGKQAAPAFAMQEPIALPSLEPLAQQMACRRNPLYKRWWYQFNRWKAQLQTGEQLKPQHVKANGFRALGAVGRNEAVVAWAAAEASPCDDVKQWALQYFGYKAGEAQKAQQEIQERKTPFLDQQSVLLTWNGVWGDFDQDPLLLLQWRASLPVDGDAQEPVVLPQCTVPHPAGAPRPALDALTEQLRLHPRMKDITDLLQARLLDWSRQFLFGSWAWAIEICSKTWADDGGIRVHIHAFLRAPHRMRVRTQEQMCFMGSRPFKSQCTGNAGRKDRLSNQGLYYVQCPKRGMVASGGNVLPYHDYLVSGEWVMNLLQQGKMDFDPARTELVKVGKNLPRLLQCLDKWQQEHDNQQLQGHIILMTAKLNALKRPFRKIPAVDAWLADFEVDALRYRFLVLEGPSGLGKTQYSMSLSPCSMEVTCSNCDEPDLRDFKPMTHNLVLLDEAKTSLVLNCKKMMQAGAAWVSLGSSSTNMYSYKVWAHKVRFVVSSNTWTYELQQCAAADRDWLVANSVHVRVSTPLYEV